MAWVSALPGSHEEKTCLGPPVLLNETWYCFVIMLNDAVLRVHDGESVTDVPLNAGQAYQRPAGIRHDVMNGSPHPIAFVEIEVKRPDALFDLARSRA